MKLRKWMALLLVFAMLSALIACGSDSEKETPTTEAPTTEAPTTEAPTTEAPTTEAPTTEAPTTEAPTTEAPTTEAPTTEATEGAPILSIVDGNTYINEALGYALVLGEEWTVADEAGLAQMAGLTADLLNDETARENLKNGVTMYDFYASKDGGMSTLNVTIAANTASALTLMDEQTMLDLTISMTKDALEASGFENLTMETAPITFAGEEHLCIELSATISGLTVYERLMMFATEECVYTLTACSFNEDLTADYLAMFIAVEE